MQAKNFAVGALSKVIKVYHNDNLNLYAMAMYNHA